MIQAHIAPEDLQKAINDIKKYHVIVQERIKDQIVASAWKVRTKAVQNCPVGRYTVSLGRGKKGKAGKRSGAIGRRLRGSIETLYGKSRLTAQVGTRVHYAPYVEFGTGGLVQVPKGLESYAMQFKGKGIRQINMRARPFLFPAAESERRNYEESMRRILSKPK